MAILCAVLKYKIILPMLVLAVIAVTVKLNQKLLSKWKNKAVEEVEKYSLKDKEVQKLSGYFVDQEEQYVSSLGNGYIMNYLVNGSLSRGFAVVSDKRVYFRGSCFSGQGKSLVRTDEERTVDIKDVTGSGFIYKRYLGILVALFMAVVTLISGVCGTAYAASVEWTETLVRQRMVEELEETVSKVRNSEKTIAKLEKQIAKKDEAVQEAQEKLAELKVAQQQEQMDNMDYDSKTIFELLRGTDIESFYRDYINDLGRIVENSSLYWKMITVRDGLVAGAPVSNYSDLPYYTKTNRMYRYLERYLAGEASGEKAFKHAVVENAGLYADVQEYFNAVLQAPVSYLFTIEACLAEERLSEENPYALISHCWDNGYLIEFDNIDREELWAELYDEIGLQFEQAYLNLLENIAPAYMKTVTQDMSFDEIEENTPSIIEIMQDYPNADYMSMLGLDSVETSYDADIAKAEDKIQTLENEKAELEEELLEVQELATDASQYENRYNSNKQESFTAFVLSAVSAAAAGLLLTFTISCLLIFADYLKKRKTMFQIQYAGGCIAFDVSFYAKAEIEDFQKQLRRTKDHVADTATVKTVTVNAPAEAPAQTNVPDELRKYAELLKEGLISQEEYDAMKKKLLGL